MPVVNYDDVPEIVMRDGITGRWISDHNLGSTGASVLRNWVEPGITVPRHLHEHEEIVLVERGSMWVEFDGQRHESQPGRALIIPPRTVHAWGTTDDSVQVLFIWPTPDPFAAGKSTYLDGDPPEIE